MLGAHAGRKLTESEVASSPTLWVVRKAGTGSGTHTHTTTSQNLRAEPLGPLAPNPTPRCGRAC